MQIRVLGCSGGIGRGLATTSFLVDEDILIDAGTGVASLMIEEMRHIRHVFLTHSHLDHIAALPLLADTLFEELVARPIIVHAQQQTIDVLHQHIFNGDIWPDFTELPSRDNAVLELCSMEAGTSTLIGGQRIEMIQVRHTVSAVAYRIESGRKAFAFSGDTTGNDNLWSALNRHHQLDLLFVETAFSNRDRELARKAGHYWPQLLASDLSMLRHRPTVCISHLKPGDEALIMDECRKALPDWELKQLKSGDVFEL
ncbi:MAG: 3',5'-cyclic-nucleotide phosphodiesterase [Gammaproteobacteria bacterium]|nr:3',5'-cyclic-nucleotide phosphodiesterase [Gammaproteobacteria bacterium]